jgi:hypothetical protein
MLTVTFDTNCLVELEEERPAAAAIRELVDYHIHGVIDAAIVAISASEYSLSAEPRNFKTFANRVSRAGMAGLGFVAPMAYFDITFYEYSLLSDQNMVNFEMHIHNILFPKSDFVWHSSMKSQSYRKWINQKCDVQAMWSHIHAKRDIFVTLDRNFHKQSKKKTLIELGARQIESPESALALMKSAPTPPPSAG